MNQSTRIQKIEEIIERDKDKPFGIQEIPWEDTLVSMNVYKIPLEYLIYNKYNGRILSRTKSLEQQNYKIDAESEDGKKLLEKLLYESNPGRNKQTLESIRNIGQQKIGIITKDGIIIDGNRRAMLLKNSEKFKLFKTVVLPVTLEENPLEIQKLETSYQMGEDEKLGYNPIEKYLKAKDLENQGVHIKEIANWMGEGESTIKDYLDIMKIMDDYLDYLNYNGIYTQLDNREDQFINLTKWLNSYYGESSGKGFDGYKNSDVDDLKIISFDYIRAKYEGKEFRILAEGFRDNHFFGNQSIWEDFRDQHFKNITPIRDEEETIDYDSDDIESYLNDRDNKYQEKSLQLLKDNLTDHKRELENKQHADKPEKLAKNALNSLETIDLRHKSSSSADVIKIIKDINDKTMKILEEKSPKILLAQIINLLSSIDIKTCAEDQDGTLDKVKEIERIAYKLEKDIKKL